MSADQRPVPARPRFPRSVYGAGSEPDPRFSLANERTFLAWIRTSLGFLAAGVAIEALQVPAAAGWRVAASVLLVVLGLASAVQAWVGWARSERALRRGAALPGLAIGLVIAFGLSLAVVLVAVGFLV